MSQSDLDLFMQTVLGETDEDENYVFCALKDSPSADTPWPPIGDARLTKYMEKELNHAFYISTMIAKRNDKGQFRNQQGSFAALWCIVLDDVGTKVDPSNLEPTWIIESSEGNYQYGYAFEEPIYDKAFASQLVATVYETSLTDGGGKMFNKFVRLPAGINGKDKGDGRNTFEVKLTKLNDTYYTPDSLLEGFGIELVDELAKAQKAANQEGVSLKRADFRRIDDPVINWLEEKGLVLESEPDDTGFHKIICPWHDGHTDGNTHASYSPIGEGELFNFRAFKCFHDHCNERKTADFLRYVKEHGGPHASIRDDIAPLVSRYVLLESSNEVADTWAKADAPYPIVSLASFRAAHRQWIVGPKGGKEYHGELWLEHPDTRRTKGRVFDPRAGIIKMMSGEPHFNTYREPNHLPIKSGEIEDLVAPYLEHIDWLIPEFEEANRFHLWLAKKIQEPWSRSFGVVMVADVAQGQEGEVYGTGRSVVGDIITRMLQTGIAKLDLTDLTGRGNGQTQYNDWADGTLIAIIEETKDEITSWTDAQASYENLKKIVDPKVTLKQRVKPKYGKIYETDLYINFLFFTNHSDALQLPEKDRRFEVYTNATGRRSIEEYRVLHDFALDPRAISALYQWYRNIDISNYNHIYPIMTKAKERMIRQGVSTLDEIWELAIESMKGCVCTKFQLLEACQEAADHDVTVMGKINGMVNGRWKKMSEFAPKWRLAHDNQKFTVRILKNHDHMQKLFAEGDYESIREELVKNGVDRETKRKAHLQAVS